MNKYIPDFITETERIEFIKWFNESLNNNINFVKGISRGKYDYELRKTTRLNLGNVIYPDVAYKIFTRIRDLYPEALFSSQCDFIAVSTFPGGDTYEHTDPGTDTTFNILMQAPDSGGELFIEDTKYAIYEKGLHIYEACSVRHSVSIVEGITPRYMFIFRLKFKGESQWEI